MYYLLQFLFLLGVDIRLLIKFNETTFYYTAHMKKTSRRPFYGVPLHLIGFMIQDVPGNIMRGRKKIDLFLNALSLRTLMIRLMPTSKW